MSKEFQWTDELARDCFRQLREAWEDPNEYGWEGLSKEIQKFKQSHTPKDKEWSLNFAKEAYKESQKPTTEDRIEAGNYFAGIKPKEQPLQRIEVEMLELRLSKPMIIDYEKLKQFIESYLNHPKAYHDWQFRYTQQQVDELCEKAFNAGKERNYQANISLGEDVFNKYQTFQDYKNSQPNSTTTTFKQPEDLTEL